jgi:hypothetical protein
VLIHVANDAAKNGHNPSDEKSGGDAKRVEAAAASPVAAPAAVANPVAKKKGGKP